MTGLLLIGGSTLTADRLAAAAEGTDLRLRAVESLPEGLKAVGGQRWVATVLSLDLQNVDLELARRIAVEGNAGAVLALSREPSPAVALGATRAGIRQVLRDPLSEDEAQRLVAGLLAFGPRVEVGEAPAADEIIGQSPQLLSVFQEVGRVADSTATVLVTGESGTGKELIARALHDTGERAKRPFIAVNCAAIPEELLESELFGHERGAFTGAIARKIGRFERADRGTLFLDEIGDMSLLVQAKILRALQEREIERLGGTERIRVDVRVIAATHRDLVERVATGEFREDLYYRLAVVRMHLPPLREREGDVRLLALHFIRHYSNLHGRSIRYATKEALGRLEEHRWPGNVRELRNVLERGVLLAPGDTLGIDHIAIDPPRPSPVGGEILDGYRSDLSLAEVEALHIRRVLLEVGGQVGRAAEILGVHRNTVSRKAAEYGIAVR